MCITGVIKLSKNGFIFSDRPTAIPAKASIPPFLALLFADFMKSVLTHSIIASISAVCFCIYKNKF